MIVPMKKAHLVVLKDDQEQLLKSLQKHSVLMLIKTGDNEDYQTTNGQVLSRIEKSIANLEKYREDDQSQLVIKYEDFIEEDPKRNEYLEESEQINENILKLKNHNQSLSEEISALKPWEKLDVKLSELSSPRLAKIHTGFIESRKMLEFDKIIEAYGGEMTSLSQDNKHLDAVLFAVYYRDNEDLLNEVKNLGFEEFTLPNTEAYVKDLIEEKQSLIEVNNQEVEQLEEKLKTLATKLKELQVLNDQLYSKMELEEASARNLTTHATCYIEGWVRSDEEQSLEEAIKEATDIYDLAIIEPASDEKPPTVTKNNKFTAPFEVITDMFSKPDPRELDPNPAMSIWYWILFGIMMGDAGYGLVMMIASHLIIKYKNPKGGTLRILKIFFYSGITTIIWGIVFGSYFGFNWDPLHEIGKLIGRPELRSIFLQPIDQPIEMLIVSLVIGALHIISGIIMKGARNFVDKEYFALFADQISWILILVGIGLLVIPQTRTIALPMVIFGALIVILTAGRHKKNIFSRLISGVLGLYDVANYMSDILSYSRILALALSTSVISMVMNMLATMVAGSIPILGIVFAVIVFLIGHVFNIAMGLLSAYVHDSRLQYVEFFGKFYDGGGYEFKPLSLKLKYVDEIKH